MLEAIVRASQTSGVKDFYTIRIDYGDAKDIPYEDLDQLSNPIPYSDTTESEPSLPDAPHFIINWSKSMMEINGE